MFKSIGKAISNAYSSVKSAVSNVFSSIGGKTNTANASNSPVFGSAAYMRQNSNAGYTYDSIGNKVKVSAGASGSWSPTLSAGQLSPGLNSGIASGSNSSGGVGSASYGPQLPVTISAGRQSTGGSSSSSPTLSLQGFNYGAFAPTTISAKSLGAQTGGLGGASLQSTGGAVGNQISLGSAPTSSNPGLVNNTGLAGTVAGYKQYNAKTGQFDDVTQTQESTLDSKVQKELDILKKYMPEKASVYEDPEVIAARNERQRLQQALQVPTAELNAIVAKQNQDLLQLRQTGSQEGVTEAVYGGQQNAINYNAAIRALPLQASISAIQGDLKLAQDYLTELTQVKQDQINKQYEYNKAQFEAIKGVLTKEDERAYKELTTKNDRAYQEQQDLIKTQKELLTNALANKAPQTIINRISNANSIQDAVMAAGQYATSADNQVVKLDDGSTVVVDRKTGTIVSNLGGTKTPSSINVTGLTPEQANDPFIQKMAKTAGGKPITDAFAQKLNKGLTVLDQIGGLQANIKNVETGPIVGLFKGANPWDTNAQTIKAQLNAIVPNLARGVFGEVGVLTDNDIAQYSKTLPNLKSTEDIRNAVLGITVDLIGKSIKQTLEVNAANQKDVSGFIDIYTNMQATRDSIFSQIPGYKGTNNTTVDYTATLDNIFK